MFSFFLRDTLRLFGRDIFLCILSSLHASMLGLGGFLELDALGIGFIIAGLDNFDLEECHCL